MAYCTPSDVATLNKARVMGQGQNPTASDVAGYITMTAGEIDAILINKGYSAPVNVASWPEAGALLQGINAKGGYWMMEEASPNSPNVDRAAKAWEAAKEMLSSADFVLNADLDIERSEPRGPFFTTHPTGATYDPSGAALPSGADNNPANPYFSRQMQF